ncbi:DUF3040 domain-containing protein [Saccharomonospora viridis]|jgi:hypothetical protein|uniref:DUF3040 domain-containing protein n=2 Tax=Saccharomonospora viridis TaxID=1852 RepID=C7MZD3_SACVD|nr:DUF3040 domain-containing protein [Saccharomonospora viridis]ACU97500.1 hypothetical protein Svir_25060 [Saccharomonospora viridis DSM 43017]KHF43664.1 membrane protein [Saccharomonospora viridis]SFP86476.1 Protein of unknown function [Saccharomonospora viridis]
MPLSEHEQRLLDQIERELYAEDPKFASAVRGTSMRRPTRRRRVQGIALFVVGVAMLVLGVAGQAPFLRIAEIPWLSVLGFLVMFGGVLLAVTALGASGEVVDPAPQGRGGHGGRGGAPAKSSFTERMEERFRRRFEDR